MYKIIFTSIIGVVCVEVLGFIIYYLGRDIEVPSTDTPTALPLAPSTTVVPINGSSSVPEPLSGPTMYLSTANGGSIQTKDFLVSSTTAKDPVNTGYYYLGYHFAQGASDQAATDTPPYVIQYTTLTRGFNIVLFQEPIGLVRRQAEQYLMAQLGVSENQLCQLKYMVSVPNRVNQFYAGVSLGFSFCPGAIEL